MTNNPYITGNVVTDSTMFFGRKEELKSLCQSMQNGDNKAVVGLRRIGKSSLIYQAVNYSVPLNVLPVLLDTLEAGVANTPLELIKLAWQSFREKAKKLQPGLRLPADVTDLVDFTEQMHSLKDKGFKAVLFFDEFEKLVHQPGFDNGFFENLRSMAGGHAHPEKKVLTYITLSKIPLEKVFQQANFSSPFHNIFTPLNLKGLLDDEAKALLEKPFQRNGLPIPSNTMLNEARQLAGCHPFYLQIVGHELFAAQAEGRAMSLAELRQAFCSQTESKFQKLWEDLETVQQATLQKLAGLPLEISYLETKVEALARYGLVEGTPPRVFSTVLADTARQNPLVILPSPPVFPIVPPTPPPPLSLPTRLWSTVRVQLTWDWKIYLLVIGVCFIVGTGGLWWWYIRPSESTVLSCHNQAYTLRLEYPHYLAVGGTREGKLFLKNRSTETVTATVALDVAQCYVVIEGRGNTTELTLYPQEEQPKSFTLAAQSGYTATQFLPSVNLNVNGTAVTCIGDIRPMEAEPSDGLIALVYWLDNFLRGIVTSIMGG